MSLADLRFKLSYNTQEDDVVKNFLLPSLKEARQYDRAVGFFSSTSLMSISVGVANIVKNRGKIRIICSPKLSEEDIEAIKKGYEIRDVVETSILKENFEPKNDFELERLNILAHLISEEILDIKVAIMKSPKTSAMFHTKMGIIYDFNNNFVAFNGSMNDSENAFYENDESIDVFTSLGSDYDRAYEKKMYFDKLWNNNESNMYILDFPKAISEKILTYKKNTVDYDIDKKELGQYAKNVEPSVPKYIEIRKYQEDAYENWKNQDYKGIFDMATGTGKTISALYSIVNLINEKKRIAIVICCPYQHLADQWAENLDNFNLKFILGHSASTQNNWKENFKNAIFNYSHEIIDKFCFVTTNGTFSTKFVQSQLNSIKGDILLVVDEAHNFGTQRLLSMLDNKYKYRLALSATLERHNDLYGTERLFEFFGEKCIIYSLDQAIEDEKLCKYYYHPIKVYLNSEELEAYNELSEQISKCIKIKDNGTIEYSKTAEMLLIKRARIVAGAQMKLNVLKDLIKQFKDENHLLVYCGATTVFDSDYNENQSSQEELRQIEAVTKILYSEGIVSSQFTSNESSTEREVLKKDFDDGSLIQALVAIRCLDEGVDIPSIDKAIILASSTNPKEYIQRRGRVLRTCPGKKFAKIYDFVTLPRNLEQITQTTDFNFDLSLIKRELLRVKDFAKSSLNEYESKQFIDDIEEKYGKIKENEYDL